MRLADGRPHILDKAKHGADLVELLAYSGCRLAEATSPGWRDVDFEKGVITITEEKVAPRITSSARRP